MIPNQPKDLPTRAPKNASGFAKQLWTQSIGQRIQLLIDPKPETASEFIRAGIESFDSPALLYYIEHEADLLPQLREWMALDNDTVRPWAQTIIRIWWPQIFAAAMNPKQILEDIRQHDPAKAAILDTPKGRDWFNATIYNLLTFFRGYARIAGDGTIQPPPNFPERMRRKALTGAARLLSKVQNPK